MTSNPQNEEILKTFDFAKYGTDGLPLKYTRENFVQDLKNALKNHTKEEQKSILKKFNLEFLDDLEGLGIIPEKLNTPEEKKLASIIENYTLKNEFLLNDKNEKSFFDSIIKGVPEFLSTIGKKQHPTHSYDVGNHTFINLQNMLKNPAYEKLSAKDKAIAKMSMLLHDLGKKGNIVDTGHAAMSKAYAKDIMPKYAKQFSAKEQQRIINQVENHHWFENYNNQQTTANQVLDLFKTKEDLEIAKIMAKADIEGVSPKFHQNIMHTKNQAEFDNKMKKILDCIDRPENTLHKNFGPEDVRIAKYTDEEWAKYEKIFQEAKRNELNTLFVLDRYRNGTLREICKDLIEQGVDFEALKKANIKEQAEIIDKNLHCTLDYFPDLNADIQNILSGKKVYNLDSETAQELVKKLDIENLDFNKFPLYRKDELMSLLSIGTGADELYRIEEKFNIVNKNLSLKGVKRPHKETIKKYLRLLEEELGLEKFMNPDEVKNNDISNKLKNSVFRHHGKTDSIKKDGINLDYSVTAGNTYSSGFYTAIIEKNAPSKWSSFGKDYLDFKIKPNAKVFDMDNISISEKTLPDGSQFSQELTNFAKKYKLSNDEVLILNEELFMPYWIRKAGYDALTVNRDGVNILCVYNPEILTMIK